MDSERRQKKFNREDFITNVELGQAIDEWAQGRVKRGNSEPTEKEKQIIGRLVGEVVVPSIIRYRSFHKNTEESELAEKITQNLSEDESKILLRAALVITKKLSNKGSERSIQMRINLSPHLVKGDAEYTRRMGYMNGEDPSVYSGEESFGYNEGWNVNNE